MAVNLKFATWYKRGDYVISQAAADGSPTNLITLRLIVRNSSGQERVFSYRAGGGARNDTYIRWERNLIEASEAYPGSLVVRKQWAMPFLNDAKARFRFDIVSGIPHGAAAVAHETPTPRDPKPPPPPSPRLFWDMAVDDFFTMYLSRSPFAGDQLVAAGSAWNKFFTGSVPLNGQERYWLHIDAADVGNVAGVLGRYWIEGGGYTFSNGKISVVTDTTPWVISRFGFGQQLETPEYSATTAPTAEMAGQKIPARWIWTNGGLDVGTHDAPLHRYLSIEIIPIGFQPPATGVSWWEIRTIAKRGEWVRRLAWHPDRKLTYSRDFGSVRAVAIIEDSLGQRVVQNRDFGLSEFLTRDWAPADLPAEEEIEEEELPIPDATGEIFL